MKSKQTNKNKHQFFDIPVHLALTVLIRHVDCIVCYQQCGWIGVVSYSVAKIQNRASISNNSIAYMCRNARMLWLDIGRFLFPQYQCARVVFIGMLILFVFIAMPINVYALQSSSTNYILQTDSFSVGSAQGDSASFKLTERGGEAAGNHSWLVTTLTGVGQHIQDTGTGISSAMRSILGAARTQANNTLANLTNNNQNEQVPAPTEPAPVVKEEVPQVKPVEPKVVSPQPIDTNKPVAPTPESFQEPVVPASGSSKSLGSVTTGSGSSVSSRIRRQAQEPQQPKDKPLGTPTPKVIIDKVITPAIITPELPKESIKKIPTTSVTEKAHNFRSTISQSTKKRTAAIANQLQNTTQSTIGKINNAAKNIKNFTQSTASSIYKTVKNFINQGVKKIQQFYFSLF